MKQIRFIVLLLLVALAVACNVKESKEKLKEHLRDRLQHQMEKTIDARLKQFMDDHLEHPESYQPLQTRFLPLSSQAELFDQAVYISARQLRRSVENYNWLVDNKHDEVARRVLETEIEPNMGVIVERVKAIRSQEAEFLGLLVEHKCRALGNEGHQVTRTYTFIIYPDEKILLLDESANVRQVAQFLDSVAAGKVRLQGVK